MTDTPTSVPSELPRSGTAIKHEGSPEMKRALDYLMNRAAAVSREDGGDEPLTALQALEAGKPYWEAVAQRNEELIGEMVALADQLNTAAREARVFRALADRYRRQLTASRSRVAALEADAERLGKIVTDIATTLLVLGSIEGEQGHYESGTIDADEMTTPEQRERIEEDHQSALAAAVGWYSAQQDRAYASRSAQQEGRDAR